MRGKVIIGIVMVTIMLLVIVAMVPTGSAIDIIEEYQAIRNGYPVNPGFVVIEITNGTTDAIKLGQEIIFNNTEDTVMIEGILGTNTDGELFSTSAFKTETVDGKIVDGIFFDTKAMTRTGTYIVTSGALTQQISVSTPTIPLELKVGPDVVSTICAGTNLRVDCSGVTDLSPYDGVDLVITDPRGRQIKTWTVDGETQKYDEINVAQLVEYGSTDPAKQIDTTDWLLGTYTFSVETEEENARGLDLRSPTKILTMLKGEVDIDVDKTEVGELQSVTVTVTGIYAHTMHVEATAGKNYVEFEEGLDDFADTYNREYGNSGYYGFDFLIEGDGQMQFSVRFYDTGAYTIEAIDTDTGDEDTVDVKVTEKEVIFDMPSTVVIGEDLEVRGTTNAGDYIDIAVEDYIVYTGIPIENDGSFEEDLRTPETRGTGAPGSIVIEAFIRVAGEIAPPLGTEISDEEEDGSVSILLTTGSLTTQLSATNVAQEDSFTVEGTAAGSDFVDIVTIAPKGGSGRGINPGSVAGVPGITHDSSAVSDIDYSYLKDLYVDEDADTGKYMVVVVSPGRNGVYDELNSAELFGSAEFNAAYGDLASKTQKQILAILMDATVDAAGSDDLMWIRTIIVGEIETETLTRKPIAGVVVGNSLEVTGETSRKEGSIIWITVKGRYHEIVPQAAIAKNNTFNATFDTTGAQPGTYTVKAIDGYGYTATTSVNIIV
ncbi:hypothetical protein C5S53_11430 [Methanophagales archaeon]|nr:hypothetical protein C5S53_11430 [Methanophagales archaeon]